MLTLLWVEVGRFMLRCALARGEGLLVAVKRWEPLQGQTDLVVAGVIRGDCLKDPLLLVP
jgi:hypothetical protein